MESGDKDWAKNYLLDPLNAPAPSEETGPGTHFRSTFAPQPGSPPSSSKNPFRTSTDLKDGGSIRARSSSNPPKVYPTPPTSASPRRAAFPDNAALSHRSRKSLDVPTSPSQNAGGRTRGMSLGERFPGDRSGQPLDIIRRESRRANRSPHLRKNHMPGADVIDRLDSAAGVNGMLYHHEGPYDATLLARNMNFMSSPVAAVAGTNAEALKATPRENVVDAVEQHRPLDGVAIIPPGGVDRSGKTYDYEEGSNMMVENGADYKRWPGMKYDRDDIKGKGQQGEQGDGMIEMQAPKRGSRDMRRSLDERRFVDSAEASGSGGGDGLKGSLGSLKRRIGSLRRKNQ